MPRLPSNLFFQLWLRFDLFSARFGRKIELVFANALKHEKAAVHNVDIILYQT
ncbi:hypothetical protein LRLP16767_LR202_00217 [Limosilactobacillus reuteri]|uniref:Uncharacterized protein n=1 Tax=Limosilactobacillus reuteri TaxID=1598 RepID=A0A0U5JQE8_LIMRT|nr:hypothetical protein LRLP16767_LR202_00217 [Limosilactobacillus reuteri]